MVGRGVSLQQTFLVSVSEGWVGLDHFQQKRGLLDYYFAASAGALLVARRKVQ